MQTPRSPASSGALPTIAPAARRSVLIVPIRLTSTTFAKRSSDVGPSRPMSFAGVPTPAHVTAMRRPRSSRPAARRTAACTESGSVTSHAIAWPPMSPASAVARSAARSATTTSAPSAASRRAVASPRPDAPPKTIAVAPLMSMVVLLLSDCSGGESLGGDGDHLVDVGDLHARATGSLAAATLVVVDRLPSAPRDERRRPLAQPRLDRLAVRSRGHVERSGTRVLENRGYGVGGALLVRADHAAGTALDPSHRVLGAQHCAVVNDDAAVVVADQAPALVERDAVERDAAIA